MQNLITSQKRRFACLLAALFICSTLGGFASATDSDGDGVLDIDDDCPFAFGTSTVDRDGCPDRDGDGTSDVNDGWSSLNPNFSLDFTLTRTDSQYDVVVDPSGEFLATADGTVIRIFNISTHAIVVSSSSLVSGNNAAINSLDWSPNGDYIAAALSDDTAAVLWANNLTVIHDGITHSGSTRTFSDVSFMANSTTFGIADERSGGGGGGCNGCSIMFVDVASGNIWKEITPNNGNTFSSIAFSPDGTRAAVGGGAGTLSIVNTTSWWVDYNININNLNIHDVDFSPDGNYISACTSAFGGNAAMRVYNAKTGQSVMSKSSSSSCYSTQINPDGTQVAYGFANTGSEAATTVVYQISTGIEIDRMDNQPGGGCGGGWNNNCAIHYGVAWDLDSFDLFTASGRRDNGIYFWHADIDSDNDGWNSTDQGDGKVDAFPDEPTQWADSDNDGYGDNPYPAFQPDACPTVQGYSTEDRFGCPDVDGDGWSDDADWAPNNPDQWADADSDGYGDNYLFDLDEYQIHVNQSGDAFPDDVTQWNDTDGDGYGDNFDNASWLTVRPSEWPGELLSFANNADVFPLDRTQWMDSDGDWVGDNENSGRPDGCPYDWGDSDIDRLGCPDTDGDGYSDPTPGWGSTTDCFGADAFVNDPTQWCDEDGDGYGSNPEGNNPDECPNAAGTSYLDRAGCPDRDGDGYSNAGDPFPDDMTQWSDRDGDQRGDNATGTNPDAFPDDPSQWKDTDGDGYGDNPGGTNGDHFWQDATQWEDTDGDGFGDNLDGYNGDVCPTQYGESTAATSRGCPDTDLDGYVDPDDDFPNDPFQWSDSDGDGYGDNVDAPGGDDCKDEFGKSTKNNTYGCPDQDLDGWADVDDPFPTDPEQWEDTDRDGYGDNYIYEMITIEDEDNPGLFIEIREQRGDAFPEIASQWSDIDGDGWGDNSSSVNRPDAFPLRTSQWLDLDGDGYGDNATFGAYQSDDCYKEPGTSTYALLGCPDSDGDTVADEEDNCPWDPSFFLLSDRSKCTITSDPNVETDSTDDTGTLLGGTAGTVTMMFGVVIFMLAVIFVAQISKTAGTRKAQKNKIEEQRLQQEAFEEEDRRQAWIQHYLSEGNFAEARKLGWEGQDGLPEWKLHEMEQQQAAEAAIPVMPDLGSLE